LFSTLATYYYYSQSFEFLSLARITPSADCKAIRRLKLSNSVGLDDIPGFVMKYCSVIFIPVPKYIFNVCLTQQYFSSLWKEAAVVRVYKRGGHASVSNYTHLCSQ
jgi:hypothetical protein